MTNSSINFEPFGVNRLNPNGLDHTVSIGIRQAQNESTLEQAEAILLSQLQALDAASPKLPLAKYLEFVGALLDQKLLALLQNLNDPVVLGSLLKQLTAISQAYTDLASDPVYANLLSGLLTNGNLGTKYQELNTAIDEYNTAYDEYTLALSVYNSSPTNANLTALNAAQAAFNQKNVALQAARNAWNTAVNTSGESSMEAINDYRATYGIPPLESPPQFSYNPTQHPLPSFSDTFEFPTVADLAVEQQLINDAITLFAAQNVQRVETKNVPVEEEVREYERDSTLLGAQGTSALEKASAGRSVALGPIDEGRSFKKVLDAFFNRYGVPIGSQYVDQISNLYQHVDVVAALSGAGAGSAILKNGRFSQAEGSVAGQVAVALGYLKGINSITQGDEFKGLVRQILSSSEAFKGLTPLQQEEMIQGLSQRIAASLLIKALKEIAVSLGAPGLLPQLLFQVAGLGDQDPLGSTEQQLYESVIFSEELADSLNISQDEADQVVLQALEQNQMLNDAALMQIADLLSSSEEQKSDILSTVREANEAAENRYIQGQMRLDAEREIAIRATLNNELINRTDVYDPDRIRKLIDELVPPLLPEAALKVLVQGGVDQRDAERGIQRAFKDLTDPKIFFKKLIIDSNITNEELFLKYQNHLLNEFNPFVGKASLRIAQDARIELENALNTIQSIYLQDRAHDAKRADRIEFAQFRESIDTLISPETSIWNPIHMGYTLLSLGLGINVGEQATQIGQYKGVAPTSTLSGG